MVRKEREYQPHFFTDSLKNILQPLGLHPLEPIKAKSGNQVCLVSPLGHREGSMAAMIDYAILGGTAKAEDVIDSLNTDEVLEYRTKLLKTKEEATLEGLILKINSHIDYYVGDHFEKHFTNVFKFDKSVIRNIRKAARAYRKYEWKPGLKRYRQALEQSILQVAEEFGQEPEQTKQQVQALDVQAKKIIVRRGPPAVDIKSSTCMGMKKDGTPCRASAGAEGYCHQHRAQGVQ